MPQTDGTVGQVLTTDGAGNLAFTDKSSTTPPPPATQGYIMELLSTLNISNNATMDVPLPGGYDRYEIRISKLLPATNHANLRILTSTNNGSTFASSAYSYSTETRDSTDTFLYGSNSDNRINMMTNSVSSPNCGALAGTGMEADIVVMNAHDSDYVAHIKGHGSFIEDDDDISYFTFAGNHRARENVNLLRFYFNNGNAVSGNIKLFGFGAI
jgi:hypothetical protein